MAAAGAASTFAIGLSRVYHRGMTSNSRKSNPNPILCLTPRSAVSPGQISLENAPTARTTASSAENGKLKKKNEKAKTISSRKAEKRVSEEEELRNRLKDLIRSDGGPPRWFSPLECGSRDHDSPLLLFLPGLDGTGLGLTMHHQSLGKIFDIWCLHIPGIDRTPFTGLVELVERTVRSESHALPSRPIYLVGESLGGCLALAVAARNPDIDLVLILVNPATSFNKSQLQPLLRLLEVLPDQLHFGFPYALSLMTGDPLRLAMDNLVKGVLPPTFGDPSTDLIAVSFYCSLLADISPRETFLWKLRMLKSASSFTNSRLHAVKARTLILSSGRDLLLPSQEEGVRLTHALPNCENRIFQESGHFLLLENGVNLVTIIKGVSLYRRGKYHDYVSDYMPPTASEIMKIYNSFRWIDVATSPVMISTLEDEKLVRGLNGIPSEGPVLFVGYHMLLGFELAPLLIRFMIERNILLRGIAHPLMFVKSSNGSLPDPSVYDIFRVMGAVPSSGTILYKLLSSKSHVLLYPGGVREALHRKGEEYRLFWPEQAEFVRMASRFGAKIVPFGVVGEDDIGELFFDYEDQMKIPYFRALIRQLTEDAVKLRTDLNGEVANQDLHLPGILPKIPGRFYYYFGKPIETEGQKQDLSDRGKCHELYLQVKSEVERCLAYLRDKRESDPYRNILPRLIYQATHGFTSEVPTFELR